jgi:histidine triad (HIT) family protein
MNNCVFCDRTKIATQVVSTTAMGYEIMVFEPLEPVVPGHLLVVPVQHANDASQGPSAAAAAFMVACQVVAQAGFEGANVLTSIGEAATQTVFHTHLHVVPRFKNDRLMLPWSPRHG